MKIILIGPVYPYKGGIAHYTSLLYNALSETHNVNLISYKVQYPQILFKKEQRDYTNDLFKVENTEFLINTVNPINIVRVGKYIKKQNPDLVLIQWWHPYFAPCYYLLEKAIGKQPKIIFTCHNVFPHERFPMDKLLTKLALKRGDAYIVHSNRDSEDLVKIKKTARFTVSPHPTYNAFKLRGLSQEEARKEIAIKDGFSVSEDSQILLFFGFVREYKGLKHLLNSMNEISQKISSIKLLVVGDFGDDKDDYMKIIRENGLKDYVCVKDGYTPDHEVEKYFAACNMVVLPYEDATQSGIVQIAYGFEKPVLVTNVGGLPDVVVNMKTGYIVEPCKPHEISESVIDFFMNHREQEMHAEIQKESERFSWNHMAQKITELV